MAAKKKTIYVTENSVVKGTSANDKFVITSETKNATIIVGNKGTDTLYFDNNLVIYYGQHKTDTKDLEIKYTISGSSEEYTLTIKNYFTSTKATDTKSSLKKVHYHLGFDYDGSFIDNTEIHNLPIAIKNNTRRGTKFSEIIDYSTVEDTGYTIYAGSGNDIIIGTQKDDVIYGQDGNDYINGNGGNDTVTGGKGNNTIVYDYSNATNYTINLTKKEQLDLGLYNVSDDDIKYEIEGNDAKIIVPKEGDGNGTIVLKNFVQKDITKYVHLTDNMGVIHDLKSEVQWEKTIAKNYNGSYLSEKINASAAEQQYKTVKKKGKKVKVETDLVIKGGNGNDEITGSAFTDNINGGNGNDTINGSLGNDKITGGKGTNTIKFTSLDQLKGDKIYLTKGEKLSINVSSIAENPDDLTYTVSGKNLVVEVNDGTNKETFTIMNFGTKDVTNNKTKKKADSSLVELITEEDTIDLRKEAVVNSEKGTYHNDLIDRSDYILYTDKKKTIVQTNTSKNGLNINGGAGADKIIGSNYSDTIKAGTGTDDNITGGTGNDKLYASTTKGSNTTFNFKAGDGKDTVYSGKGKDTLVFDGISVTDITYKQGTKKNNKDLIIKYSEDDSVTVKNYFTVNKKGVITGINSKNSIKNIVTTNGIFALSDIYQINNYILNVTEDVPMDSNNTTNDLIIATGTGYQNIYGNAGNDVIYASNRAEKNYLHGDDGDDIFYIAKNRFTRIYTDSGNDIIHAEDLSNVQKISGEYINYYTLGDGNNTLYLGKRGATALTVSCGKGNDTIYLSTEDAKNGKGESHFYLASGSTKEGGHDTFIYQNGYTDGYRDILVLDAIKYDDIIATKAKGSNDLVLRYGNDSDITFKDYFKAGNENFGKSLSIRTSENSYVLESLVSDKSIVTQIKGLTGTKSNDYIIGTDKSETIKANAGNDAIKPYGGNDKINLGTGNDIVLAGNGNKTIAAVSGNNVISLGNGNNNVTTGTGSDRINSGSGSNIITFISNDIGSNEYKYGGGTDTLVFKGAKLNDMSLDTTGSNPVINTNSNTVTLLNLNDFKNGVTIKDSTGVTSTIFDMHTVAGNQNSSAGQEINTSIGNDIIYTGLGSDVINAGSGENTIHLRRKVGSGNNNEYTYAGGTDTFVLDNYDDFSSFSMQKSDNDLIIGYDGDFIDNTLVIKNYYTDESINESINFTAGEETKTLKVLLNEIGLIESIQGTDGNDNNLGDSTTSKPQYIYGMGGNDTITGGSGKDYINGGSGNDSMLGGANNDVYEIDEVDWGNDKDVINDTAGTDTLKINTTSDKINLFFDVVLKKEEGVVLTDGIDAQYTTGNHLYINSDSNYTFENATNYTGVKIENYFNDGKIENIQIPSGTGNDYKNAVDTDVMSKVGQAVANWLNTYNFDSVSDVLTRGTDIQKANVIGLFKPIMGTEYNLNGTDDHNLIIATGTGYQNIYGNAGNDVIYASNRAEKNYIHGGDGDDIFYIAKNRFTRIYTDSGNDIIHAEDLSNVQKISGEYINYYILGDGNNTLYLGKRGATALTVSCGKGNDTIYLSTEDANSQKGNTHFFVTSGSSTEGGHDTFIYQNGYTDGYKDIINMQTINNTDIIATKAQESNDLVLRYGNDSDITFKDYFKTGNENFGKALYIFAKSNATLFINEMVSNIGVKNYITGDSGTISGTTDNDYIKVTSENDIIINDPNGNDYYNLTFDSNRTITDTAGDDILLLGAKKADISLMFNVTKEGNFESGDDKLILTSGGKNVVINGFNSIESIRTADGYKIDDLAQLKSQVVSWLTSANGEAGYTDVTTALSSEDSDLSTLVALLNDNWQQV